MICKTQLGTTTTSTLTMRINENGWPPSEDVGPLDSSWWTNLMHYEDGVPPTIGLSVYFPDGVKPAF